MRTAALGIALLGLVVAGRAAESGKQAAPAAKLPVAKKVVTWDQLLLPPRSKAKTVPAGWKLASESGNPAPVGYDAPGEVDGTSKALYQLTRDSPVIVVGIGAGSDGGYSTLPLPTEGSTQRFATYYLKAFGYLKDETGRREPFLKILGPGFSRDAGLQGAGRHPAPYLETGRRYLLYLVPNHGIPWGSKGPTFNPVGKAGDFWASSFGFGFWYENGAGKLASPYYSAKPWPESGKDLPFGEAVKRVLAAIKKHQEHEKSPGSKSASVKRRNR